MNAQVIGVVGALVAGLAMGAGYASVVHPLAGLGIVVVLLGGALVWVRPLWGLALMIALIPIEGSLWLDIGASLTRLLGVGVTGAWFLRKMIRGESWDRILRTPVLVLLAIFVAYVALSSLWARLPFPVPSELFRLVMFVALPVLIIDLVRSRADVSLLVKAVVVGGLVATGLTLLQTFGPNSVRRAGSGVGGGINTTALFLTCLVPLAFYLLRATRFPWSLVGLLYVLLAPIAVAGTLSRMSMLLLAGVLTIELFHSLVRGRSRAMILLVGSAGVAILVVTLPMEQLAPRFTERIKTIGPYIEATLQRPEGGIVASSGRGFHIRVALAIFRDHPWFGAGYRNYPRLFIQEYQAELWGADGYVYATPRSPHGTLWGFLAELGVIGTAIWLSVMGATLLALVRAKPPAGDGASEDLALRRAAFLLLLLFLGYHSWAMVHTSKLFWLAVGLGIAVSKLLRGDTDAEGRPEAPRTIPIPSQLPENRPVATVVPATSTLP